MNHSAAHRDGVFQRFISDADLFERMNAARRNRQIDRTPADEVAFARDRPAFRKDLRRAHAVPGRPRAIRPPGRYR